MDFVVKRRSVMRLRHEHVVNRRSSVGKRHLVNHGLRSLG